MQCGTHNLAFLKRFDEPGKVYVATSAARRYTKIGTTSDVETRIRSICSYGYGGATDWKVHFSVDAGAAGRVEFKAHQLLAGRRAVASYVREGSKVDCQELFLCSADEGVEAVNAAKKSISAARI